MHGLFPNLGVTLYCTIGVFDAILYIVVIHMSLWIAIILNAYDGNGATAFH